jgi:hypothetical protein
MRALKRNQVKCYFAIYEGEKLIKNAEGYYTGEKELTYSKPTMLMANISQATGLSSSEQFGTNLDYDKSIVIDRLPRGLDEYSRLWIDTLPTLEKDGSTSTPHDYVVKRVARSLNSVSIAVAKVDVKA